MSDPEGMTKRSKLFCLEHQFNVAPQSYCKEAVEMAKQAVYQVRMDEDIKNLPIKV